jgi:hypothetical protein
LKDLTIHSLVFRNEVVAVMGKLISKGGVLPSSCKYALLGVPRIPREGWPVLADNVTLEYPAGTAVGTDIRGLVQVRDWAYGVDYDWQKILIMRVNELNGLFGVSHTMEQAPFDLTTGTPPILPTDAKGWSIATAHYEGVDYVFALYNRANAGATAYDPSILVRMTVNTDGSLTLVDTLVLYDVLNAQGFGLSITKDGTVVGFIPAVGGPQNGGFTNAQNSMLVLVENLFGAAGTMTYSILLTGDETPPATGTLPTGDISGFIAAMRPGGVAYVRAGMYNSTWTSENYTYYKTTVTKLMELKANPRSLFEAFELGILEAVDEGAVTSSYPTIGRDAPCGIFFHDMVIIHGDCAEDDELHVFKGSKLEVHSVLTYGARYTGFGLGYAEGQIGGYNTNAADATGESERQIRDRMHHKHGARITRVGPAAAAEEEEEDEEQGTGKK